MMRAAVLLALLVPLAGCLQDAGAPPEGGREPVETASEPGAAGNASSWSGVATFKVTGACAPLPPRGHGCAGYTALEPGPLRLDAPAQGLVLEATWTPAGPVYEEMSVWLAKGRTLVARQDGPSPIRIVLPDLEPGGYKVRLFPRGTGVGTSEQQVQWTVAPPAQPPAGGGA